MQGVVDGAGLVINCLIHPPTFFDILEGSREIRANKDQIDLRERAEEHKEMNGFNLYHLS